MTNPIKPQGLYYLDNAISTELSCDIINRLDSNGKWRSITESPNSRQVQHYGYTYNYSKQNAADPAEPFPDYIETLAQLCYEKCVALGLDPKNPFNQCIINNYLPGQGISQHIDVTTYGPIICCLTIGSGAVMRFTKGNQLYDHYVQGDSLYIMSEESRYDWKHEMPSRKSDIVNGKRIQRGRRISITFRTIDV